MGISTSFSVGNKFNLKMYCYISAFLVFITLFFFNVQGETCLSPHVTSAVYTTSEVHLSSQTVIVAEFHVTCKNSLKDLKLYADFNGKTVPVVKKVATEDHQVSFTQVHKVMPTGTYTIKVYDDEGFANLRKAQRSGEDVSSINSLFVLNFEHKEASSGPVVSSEFVAASLAILVCYFAQKKRASLQD